MALVEINRVVVKRSATLPGNPLIALAGATVSLLIGGTAVPPTLYATEALGSPNVTGITTTDSEGRVQAWVEEGSYDVTISHPDLIAEPPERWDLSRGEKFFEYMRSYPLSGLIEPQAGNANYLPLFEVAIAIGQTLEILRMSTYIRAGTQVNFKIVKATAGVVADLAGWGSDTEPLISSPDKDTVGSPVTLVDEDEIGIVVVGTIAEIEEGMHNNFRFRLSGI